MILQDLDLGRILIVFILQQSLAAIYIIISIIILKRKINRFSFLLSLFYIFTGGGFILNAIFISFTTFLPINEILLYSLYFLAFNLIFVANIFVLVFIINLLKIKSDKRDILIISSFILIIIITDFIPGGITFDADWRPIFSWYYFLTITLFYTFSILIPTLYYSYRLYSQIETKNLRKKLFIFISGLIGIIIIQYGAALFNTYPPFRNVWSIIAFLITIPSVIFIYYGIAYRL